MSASAVTHALLDVERTEPKSWELYPDFVALCACGRRGPRCMFQENALSDQARHEQDPSFGGEQCAK